LFELNCAAVRSTGQVHLSAKDQIISPSDDHINIFRSSFVVTCGQHQWII